MVAIIFYGLLLLAMITTFAAAYINLTNDIIDDLVSSWTGLSNVVIDGTSFPVVDFLIFAGVPGALGIILSAMFWSVVLRIARVILIAIPG